MAETQNPEYCLFGCPFGLLEGEVRVSLNFGILGFAEEVTMEIPKTYSRLSNA